MTQTLSVSGHVFTLHAELEGMKFLPVLHQLLSGWRTQGYHLGGLRSLASRMPIVGWPRHEVAYGNVPGRTGALLIQGPAVLPKYGIPYD